METIKKGSDLLSKRLIAMSGLIMALSNIGFPPISVVAVSIILVFILRE